MNDPFVIRCCLVDFVNTEIKTFFIFTKHRCAEPCMMFHKVIVYRIVDFI